jgi:peroxiredoxin
VKGLAHTSGLTTAPPFELPTQKGGVSSLAQFLEKGPVLLAFHRGTW